MHTSQVTKVELIDHTTCKHCDGSGRMYSSALGRNIECGACGGSGMPGRSVILRDANKQVELQLQDDDRTLKIFISERKDA